MQFIIDISTLELWNEGAIEKQEQMNSESLLEKAHQL
jgi:hypothetical protein